jgi:hypothetical protein
MFHPVPITDVEVVGESFRLLRMQGVFDFLDMPIFKDDSDEIERHALGIV